MIGDRIDNDIVPSKQLGMKTVWEKQGFGSLRSITDKSKKTDIEIDNLSDILNICEYYRAVGSSAIIRSSRFLYISIWLLATACHTDHTLFVLSFLICCWFPQQNHYCNHMLRHFQQHLYHDLILQQNSLVA